MFRHALFSANHRRREETKMSQLNQSEELHLMMMDWEDGTVTAEDEIRLFQNLVDTRLAWSLQGMYGRQAARLIEAGLIRTPFHNRPHPAPLAAGISDLYEIGEKE